MSSSSAKRRGRHSQAHGIGTYNDEEGISYAGGLWGSKQGLKSLPTGKSQRQTADIFLYVTKRNNRCTQRYGQHVSIHPKLGIEGVRVQVAQGEWVDDHPGGLGIWAAL